MARRSEHSLEELKVLVLSAAETIVVEEGFSALKVRTIAMEIGYTVGSIYMVFTNMADLIMHINAGTLDAIATQLEQVQKEGGAEQSIQILARSYLRYASQNFNRWHAVFDYSLSVDSKITAWYQEKVDKVFALLEVPFLEFAPALSEDHRKRAVRALWFGVHGVCALSLKGQSDKADIDDIEETLALLVKNFMHGLTPSP
ncbi:MAG: WHG domain-containing protein [Methylococcaceae bacterium]